LSTVVLATIVPRPEHRDEVVVLRAVPAGDPAKGQL
jgi:hypothetical protein